MKIQVLPDHVANKIAAGEVVERPASIVRELVDNSVDAGASEVRVSIVEGGHVAIVVSDTGSGMGPEDAVLAFARHATSKLTDERDLWGIRTLGFRGEALPSIAAVSKVTLCTRRKEDSAAVQIRIEGGKQISVERTPGSPGTSVEVRSLFYNTPARRKFLRSPRGEEQRIKSWMTALALVHPQIRFVLVADGDEVLNLAPRTDSIERGRELLKGTLVEVTGSDGESTVRGLVAHPSQALPDTRGITLFVNRRPVTDRSLARAAKDGYGALLKDRQYPAGFLYLEIPGADVDVNVHPQKSEVRFAHGDRLYSLVRRAVTRALEELRLPMTSGVPTPGTIPAHDDPAFVPPLEYASILVPQPFAFFGEASASTTVQASTPEPLDSFRFSALRYIGQTLGCYLLCDWEGALVVVDMHAAHERWNYNRILKILRTRNPESQPLLFPMEAEFSPEEIDQLDQHRELLEQLGFTLETQTSGNLKVHAVPGLLSGRDVIAFLREIAVLETTAVAGQRYARLEEEIASRLACHASVRAGRELEREEVYALFTLMDSTECAASCPHGRPVVVSFSGYDIERWFCRV